MADRKKRQAKRKGSEPHYLPTKREIAAKAAEIRAGWSKAELRKRAGLEPEEPWTPPEMHDPREDW